MTLDMRSTKPMEIMAPTKAAPIIIRELTRRDHPKEHTITRATTSLAPEEIPNVKGPAMGLWKKVWSR